MARIRVICDLATFVPTLVKSLGGELLIGPALRSEKVQKFSKLMDFLGFSWKLSGKTCLQKCFGKSEPKNILGCQPF